ncbi:MAG: hypothetical protein R3E57_07160 [Porticoccaceae bacterium]
MSQQNGETGQTRKQLLDELDKLRYALHDGPEFQHDIPLLNEPFEQLDDDLDLHIPILTDTCDDAPAETAVAISEDCISPPELAQEAAIPVLETEAAAIPASPAETDSDTDWDNLEQLLDELVAEHLPKLEQKLRGRLRQMIQQGQLDLLDNHVDEG